MAGLVTPGLKNIAAPQAPPLGVGYVTKAEARFDLIIYINATAAPVQGILM